MKTRRLALAAILAAGMYGCSSPDETTVATPGEQPSAAISSFQEEGEIGVTKPQDQGYKMGIPVDVGGWSITVNSVKCGLPEIPPSTLNGEEHDPDKPGEGAEFCRVTAKTKNTGEHPGLMPSDQQYGWAGDTEFDPFGYSPNAMDRMTGSFIGFQANPGQVGTGEIWFEVPKGTKLTDLEVHGDPALTNGTGTLIKLV